MKTAIALMMVPTLLLVGCKKKQPPRGERAPVAAPQTAKAKGVPAAAQVPAGRISFLDDFIGDLKYTEKQLLRLAKAIPQSKYTWRASPQTMSLAELFLHIAGAHFGISGAAGHPPPADIKGKNLKTSTTDKQKIIALLKRGFAHAREAAAKAKGTDLSVTKKLWGKPRSKRFPFLVMMVHQHEHLGQIKAWTRSAGVAKPWLKKKRKGKRKKGAKAKQ